MLTSTIINTPKENKLYLQPLPQPQINSHGNKMKIKIPNFPIDSSKPKFKVIRLNILTLPSK